MANGRVQLASARYDAAFAEHKQAATARHTETEGARMNEASEVQWQAWDEPGAQAIEAAPAGRRRLLRAGAGSGLGLAASGLFRPDWLEEAAAREGALDGARGGRRGEEPLRCTFSYRNKTGLDDYDLPTADSAFSIGEGESHRYDPDRFRVGVLLKPFMRSGFDLYVDVRNVSVWFPRGGVTQGSNLDPASGKFGAIYIREQEFAEREAAETSGISFRRANDTSGIEWRFVI